MNRPPVTLLLAVVALLSGISHALISLQFLGVISWREDDLDFWGGKWAGFFLYGLAAVLGLLVAYGWLELQPWALNMTVLLAFLGFADPFMAFLAGTETFSTVLVPIAINILIIYLALRKDVRDAVRSTPPLIPDSV